VQRGHEGLADARAAVGKSDEVAGRGAGDAENGVLAGDQFGGVHPHGRFDAEDAALPELAEVELAVGILPETGKRGEETGLAEFVGSVDELDDAVAVVADGENLVAAV